jgi:hypothetical protein
MNKDDNNAEILYNKYRSLGTYKFKQIWHD